MVDLLAIILMFGTLGAVMLAISPIGRAIADRIRESGAAGSSKKLEELRDSQMAVLEELDALRHEVTELQERLDFTERVLSKQREVGRLPGGGEASR